MNGKRFLKTSLALAAIVAVVFCVTGCFDRRELDTLGIVMGVAIDKAADEGEAELTVQLANPSGGKSSGAKSKTSKEGGGGGAFINVSESGRNINYIVREMQHKMSRLIYVAHSQALIMSEDLARNGVRDSLDFFARAAEARMTVYVFVAEGKAKAILDVEPEFEKLPSVEISKILLDQKVTSRAPIVTEFEFVSKLTSKTSSAIAPMVSIIDDGGKERLQISGCAAFKESRMVGRLGEKETRGLLFVINKIKTGAMQVDVRGETATVELRSAKGSVTPTLYSDGTAEFLVKAEATVGLGDQTGTINLADPDNAPDLIKAAAAIIRDEIESAVAKSKELDADVFGFGEYLHRKYPDEWKRMKNTWDERYPDIKVTVDVMVKADGSGRIVKPLVPEED